MGWSFPNVYVHVYCDWKVIPQVYVSSEMVIPHIKKLFTMEQSFPTYKDVTKGRSFPMYMEKIFIEEWRFVSKLNMVNIQTPTWGC